MKTLLKSFVMTILAGVVGAGLGILGWLVIASIAMPNLHTTILSIEEVALFEGRLGTYNFFLQPVINIIILALTIIVAIAYIIIFLKSLNPEFGFRWFRTHLIKMLIVIALLLISCAMMIYIVFSPVPIEYAGFTPLPIIAVIVGAILIGVICSIVGRTGVGSEAPSIIISFFAGVITFMVLSVLVYFASYFCFDWIFKLVTEVWGGWGEANLHGLFIFLYAIIPSFACVFGIAGGLALFLNPAKMNIKTRLHFLIIPLILIIGVLIFAVSFHNNAATKYDFGKKTLTQACGVPEYATDTLSVVFFGSESGIPIAGIEKWPLSVQPMSFIGAGEVDVSMASLKKIEEYVKGHSAQTLFTRPARDAMWRGYERNWMVKEAIPYHFISTRDYLITRMLFLLRLQKAMVTEEIISYADHFSNEANYSIGKDGARSLARIFNHIGMPDKAKFWALRSEQPEKIEISEHPLLTDGIISGTIILNEEPFRGRVALLSTQADEVTTISGIMNIVGATVVEHGLFSFENIGEGKYFLAVMVEDEVSEVEVKHNPGIVEISSETPKLDFGEINIWIK